MMPIRELIGALDPSAPPEVVEASRSLRYRDFITVALILDEPKLFPDTWIYRIAEPAVCIACGPREQPGQVPA